LNLHGVDGLLSAAQQIVKLRKICEPECTISKVNSVNSVVFSAGKSSISNIVVREVAAWFLCDLVKFAVDIHSSKAIACGIVGEV